jgi:tetratricopeptide (TPR) repeat protein
MAKKMTPSEAEVFTQKLSKYVLTGKYKEALPLAKEALKEHPQDLVCQYQYAKLLGDWADELPLAKRKKLKAEAVKILGRLTGRLNGQPMERRFGICLNYYYQSSAFKEMYGFGKRFLATDRRKGLYAQALGACLQAERLASEGNESSKKLWAAKSAKAWKQYGLKNEPYYFAHYSYAKALALLGTPEEALKNLKIAARISRRPLSDWEFKDVLDFIKLSRS